MHCNVDMLHRVRGGAWCEVAGAGMQADEHRPGQGQLAHSSAAGRARVSCGGVPRDEACGVGAAKRKGAAVKGLQDAGGRLRQMRTAE